MLQPTDLAHALTHDRADQRARALLNLGWETRPNALVNDLVTASWPGSYKQTGSWLVRLTWLTTVPAPS